MRCDGAIYLDNDVIQMAQGGVILQHPFYGLFILVQVYVYGPKLRTR